MSIFIAAKIYFYYSILNAKVILNQNVDGRDIIESDYKQKILLFLSHSLKTFFTLRNFSFNKYHSQVKRLFYV